MLRIIAHLRARNAIASIIKSTEERYRDAAEAGQMSDRARVMYLHKDMVNLLQATPQTCPAVISPLLLQRLGDRAKTILEGK